MQEPLAEQRKLIDETWYLIAMAQEQIDRAKRTILVTRAFVAKSRVLTQHSAQNPKR
jgi:hypothetical protein